MILLHAEITPAQIGLPRMRGDDPVSELTGSGVLEFAPHARG